MLRFCDIIPNTDTAGYSTTTAAEITMTTPVFNTESAYVHSDDESLPLNDNTTPSDDESAEEPCDPDEMDTKLLDAEDFVFEQNKGALNVSLYGPSQTSTKVSGILTHAGKLVRIEEEGAGYLHPSFGAFRSLATFR
jgi:hypothetical protein